jgi:hypothetical protein
MAPRATVLIPTHEHGPLLRLAAATALNQSVEEVEVFIVLDGADAETTFVAESIADDDPRVRVFHNPKGERHGETHRHRALQEASGQIVCYLSDDDLWFPDHVEYLEGLLQGADFAHALAVVVGVDGRLRTPHVGDLTDPSHRERLLNGLNFIPLSTAAHTLAAYESLPNGWTSAPAEVPTDLHMWQRFVALPAMRLASGGRPTVLHLPTSRRPDMGADERLSEMRSWSVQIGNPDTGKRLRLALLEVLWSHAASVGGRTLWVEASLERTRRDLDEVREDLDSTRAELQGELAEALRRESGLELDVAEGRRRESELELELAESHQRRAALERRLAAIRGSIAYRASRRLARIPIIGTIGRWVGRVLAREGDR